MARISRLTLWGWMPFADEYVLELPAGPIAVVARYVGNPRRSNWAGKTSLIEAITWCLFGQHRKRLEDGVINNARQECGVELELSDLMVVRRVRKRGSATVLTVNLGDEVRRGAAAQEVILDRLCMAHEDYTATVDFTQDDIESLVGMRSGDRRKVISAWLRMERWAQAGRSATDALRNASNGLLAARVMRSSLTGLLTQEEEQTGRTLLERASTDLVDRRARLGAIDAELSKLESPDALARSIDELTRLRKESVVLRFQLKERPAAEQAVSKARVMLDEHRAVLRSAEVRVGDLQAIKEAGFDGVCPITCSACKVATEVTAFVQRSATLLPDAVNAQLEAHGALNKALIPTAPIEARLRELGRVGGQYATMVSRGKELAALVAGQTHTAVAELRAKRSRLEQERVDVLAAFQAAVRVETEWTGKLDALATVRAQAAKCDADIAAFEAAVRVAGLVVRALGPAGVPTRIARAHVARLEHIANGLLADSALSLEFAWERPTKDLEPICMECGHLYAGQRDKKCPGCAAARGPKMSDELELLVDDGSGEIEDVRAKSGGARILVASALRLAASAMLRDVRSTPVAWATVDEPFGPLDTENREGLARIFTGMLGAVGLEQAFVVSHDVVLLDRLPHRLVIEREGSSSTLHLEAS